MSNIATSSIEEALDFAFNLVMPILCETGDRDKNQAPKLLRQVSDFVSLRYAGELVLAFEWLQNFEDLHSLEFPDRENQFKKQMNWLENEIE
ncbi:hypothetical protein ABFV74_16505 [Pseudoalteromonas distincta]|uniref:hypothetical protein n=1 Tax=Pseudoalteromonas distincta TaxID=77608 RepID=UPI0032183235